MTWQNKVLGILGLWVIALAFLGFSDSFKRILFVLTGIAIAVIVFWGKKIIRPTGDLLKYLEKEGYGVEAKSVEEPAAPDGGEPSPRGEAAGSPENSGLEPQQSKQPGNEVVAENKPELPEEKVSL